MYMPGPAVCAALGGGLRRSRSLKRFANERIAEPSTELTYISSLDNPKGHT
jgi:hypothetical protein